MLSFFILWSLVFYVQWHSKFVYLYYPIYVKCKVDIVSNSTEAGMAGADIFIGGVYPNGTAYGNVSI